MGKAWGHSRPLPEQEYQVAAWNLGKAHLLTRPQLFSFVKRGYVPHAAKGPSASWSPANQLLVNVMDARKIVVLGLGWPSVLPVEGDNMHILRL